jgi:hypothetical protein
MRSLVCSDLPEALREPDAEESLLLAADEPLELMPLEELSPLGELETSPSDAEAAESPELVSLVDVSVA